MYQCPVCRHTALTNSARFQHCGIVLEWKGEKIMLGKMVRIKVSGYVEMREGNLDDILKSYEKNPHTGLLYSLHMGYCNAEGFEFDIPDKVEKKEEKKVEVKTTVQGKGKGKTWAWEKGKKSGGGGRV